MTFRTTKLALLLFFMSAAPLVAQDLSSAGPTREASAQRTKEFIVMGYEGIIFELRSGDGSYLKTLTDLLRTNPDDRRKTLDRIESLSKTHLNIMDFADEVLKLQQTGASAAQTPVAPPTGPTIYSGEQLENVLTHLTRGMKVTVYSKGGRQYSGQFEEYAARRLWIKGAARKSFLLDDIVAIDAPRL